jgi:mRNA-degrading endonuclease RelE of RelBE toxin-antitoxin system
MKQPYVTVVEHKHYQALAEKLLSPEQMKEIVDMLAAHPESGVLIKGTGGFRKVRYAGVPGKGKSGGVRVIHFFVTQDQEVHLVDIYGKGDQASITDADKKELAKLAKILKGK